MRVLLRADAGHGVGVGHALRCLAVAEGALQRGWQVEFSGSLQSPEWLSVAIERRGITCLAATSSAAALADVAVARGHSVVHVDHYGLESELRRALSERGVLLVNVEDGLFGRRPADVVLDPTLGAEHAGRVDDGSGVLLRGVDFALLRREVVDLRGRRRRSMPGKPLRVLVVMGGTDVAGMSGDVIRALASSSLPLDVAVVGTWDGGGVASQFQVTTLRQGDDLPTLMVESDLVVSAAGSTVWELSCLGVPMALIQVADNQAMGYSAVVESGAAVGLGEAGELRGHPARIAGRLQPVLIDPALRSRISAHASGLVDGDGVRRLLDTIEACL